MLVEVLLYWVIQNDSSKSKCLWNEYYLWHCHKHISNKNQNFQFFYGVPQLPLIMITKIILTLQNKMVTSVQKAFCVKYCLKVQNVIKVQRAFRVQYRLKAPTSQSVRRWFKQSGYSLKVNAFIAISRCYVYGPFAVNGAAYVVVLENWLIRQLQQEINNFIFQQDGAPPHWHQNAYCTDIIILFPT